MHGELPAIVHGHVGEKPLVPRDKPSLLQDLSELHFFHPLRLLSGIIRSRYGPFRDNLLQRLADNGPLPRHTFKQKASIMPDTPAKKKAVALRYDRNRDAAPKVVAKGTGELAAKIVALAKE